MDDMASIIRRRIKRRIIRIMNVEYRVNEEKLHKKIDRLVLICEEDLASLKKRDPALHQLSVQSIFHYSLAFRALLYYRIGHTLITHKLATEEAVYANYQNILGRTGIDIHPRARIGRSFVLDHAPGTVIGETSIIGENCYVFGNVIIGARGIAGNDNFKRHPTIGDNVQIGSNAKIFGNIRIGDNVFISPNTVITRDIPSNMRVILSNLIQITTPLSEVGIYGVIPINYGFKIYGKNLERIKNILLAEDHKNYDMGMYHRSGGSISVHIHSYMDRSPNLDNTLIILESHDSDIVIHSSQGLRIYKENLSDRNLISTQRR